MYDMLPFPNITATNIEELTFQANNYLIQFKETLEFILANIGPDNLSQDLMEKLNSLGAEVEKTVEETEDQFQQVAGKTITVADVINSPAFKNAVPKVYLESIEEVDGAININAIEDKNGDGVEEKKKYTIDTLSSVEFTVNFETGNLEYNKG